MKIKKKTISFSESISRHCGCVFHYIHVNFHVSLCFFRSDTHLRHTSTSTSNYNSTSDGPSYLRGFDHEPSLVRHREVVEENGRDVVRGDSDSDSDGSEGRSLELASSHSSDEEESSSKIQRNRRMNGNYNHSFISHYTTNGLYNNCILPNCEGNNG